MLYQLTSSGFRCFCPFIAAAVSSHRRKGPVFSPHLGRTRGVRPPFLPGGIVCPAPQKRDARGRLFFCGCPQVLLSALPPTARKGECEGGTFDGFPHSRSIARPQATTFAEQKCCSKKKDTPRGVFLFGAGYGSRTRLNGLGSRCNTDIPTLRFTYRVIVAYRRRFCNRKLCRKGMNVLSRRIPIEKSLEGTL